MCSRHQLKRDARLTAEDLVQIGRCRRPQNRLGFGYQLAFVRLLNRFPKQQPFEVVDDLVNFTAVQLGVDAALIEHYHRRRQTISEHQRAIVVYLGMRDFGAAEATLLETFVFEESCRLEQSTALQARARELLKEQRILEPAESRIARLVGEQRKAAAEHIFRGITAGITDDLAHALDDLLVVSSRPESTISGLSTSRQRLWWPVWRGPSCGRGPQPHVVLAQSARAGVLGPSGNIEVCVTT